ncbi:YbaB/EbfC family nucleoid-associated protein [Mycoplasmopsis pulmonis]|nr:YbaB/EbfC family nucleoid-associated protein [Mycoplasmopsis pulmonis]VEU67842.1 UPF0133 protein MALL_0399 [Mycoplasmopsis pulmonis]
MNINEMLKQAKKMQSEIELKEKELYKKEFTIEKQGLTLVLNGKREVLKIDINEALVDPEDKDILEDLLLLAFNEAMEKIDEAHKEIEKQIPSGKLPF